MCPDRQIISIYLDGELPSPWKEKMETHLGGCPECRALLADYRHAGECLKDLPGDSAEATPDEIMEAARDRVWQKLSAPKLSAPKQKPVRQTRGLWKRSITLPLPAAAAAIVVIIAFAALAGFGSRKAVPMDAVTATGIVEDQGVVPIEDMNRVVQYLSSEDSGDFMVIRLPESRTFSRTGEPALINAADYSRSTVSR